MIPGLFKPLNLWSFSERYMELYNSLNCLAERLPYYRRLKLTGVCELSIKLTSDATPAALSVVSLT